jgi:hypothetical protein
MDSREKVELYLRESAAQAAPGNPLMAALPAMLPMVLGTLPEDPAVLDEALVNYAAVMLYLRSDGAEPVHVAAGEPEPEPDEVAT